jgi:hypothetical protein
MKLVSRIAAVALAAAIALPAAAQDRVGQGRFGVGAGISNGGLVDFLLFVPMNLAPNLRVEPFLGWQRSDVDAAPAGVGGSAFDPPQGKSSDFMLGAGLFYVKPIAAQVQLYVGGRLGLQWQSVQAPSPGTAKAERRNTLLAAALGGEYLLHPRFALGAEAMIARVGFGDTEFSGTGGPAVDGGGGSASATQGTLFARVYLF